MNGAARIAALVGLAAAAGCGTALNYPGNGGPRYAGSPAAGPDAARRSAPASLRVVTFNTHFARRVDRVTELLRAERLVDADVVALQEVDARATRRIATALGMSYVYYPGAVHPATGRDFGNAVLSRWPIVEDWKIVLPHRGSFRDTQRTATAATILVGADSLRVYSVHLSTMGEMGPGSRREQARAVLADAARFRRVIVGGDLNSVRLGEEFLACGFRWPTRNNAPTIHVFTWDHIFLRGMEAGDDPSTGVVDDDNGASDHRPVWAVARFSPTGRPGGEDHPSEGCVPLHQNRT